MARPTDDANGVRPAEEISFLRTLWNSGRPFAAIVAEMIALDWTPGEIDLHLERVTGPISIRAYHVLENDF